jgi:hypothetical protein
MEDESIESSEEIDGHSKDENSSQIPTINP